MRPRILRVSLLVFAACNSSSPAKTMHTLYIGGSIDESGPTALPTAAPALTMAISDFNTALASNGGAFTSDQFKAVINDSTSTASVATAQALNMVTDAGVVALITDGTADTIAVNYLHYDGGIPFAVPQVSFLANATSVINLNYVTPDGGDPAATLAYQNAGGWLFRTIAVQTDALNCLIRPLQAIDNNLDLNGDGKFQVSLVSTPPNHPDFVAASTVWEGKTSLPSGAELLELPTTVTTAAQFNWNDLTTWLDDDLDESVCGACSSSDCTCASGVTPSAIPQPDLIIPALLPEFSGIVYNDLASQSAKVVNVFTFHLSANLEALGSQANGAEGVSYVVANSDQSGTTFMNEMAAQSLTPDQDDSRAYDAAALVMLGTVYAAHANNLTDLSMVTGTMIKDGMMKINDPAGQSVGAGPTEFAKGIAYLAAGTAINYDGASGPCDFDATNTVTNNYTHFVVKNQQFVDEEIFDCVSDPSCPCVANGQYTCAAGE